MSFTPKLQGHKVKWFTDNQSVRSIVTNGSKKTHLQDGALCIFETCMKYSLRLEVEWIPRSLNEQADYLSRIMDYDDWKVDPSWFAVLDTLWGPYTVDCFASCYNKQISRFYSRFWSPGAEGVDAFTVDWQGEVCWWVPPLHLVMRVVKHARRCMATGTLVVPAWKSASYWAVLCPDGAHFADFIYHWEKVHFYPQLVQDGCSAMASILAVPCPIHCQEV